MAATKRNPTERERDLVEIQRQYLQGKTQHQISEWIDGNRSYSLTQQQISEDLKTLRQRWMAESTTLIDDAVSKELARIDNLEREYWQAWEDSKQAQKTTEAERTEDRNARSRTSVKEVTREGNPAFLRGVEWCIMERCKLLGLDAPSKFALTDKDGGNLDLGVTLHLPTNMRDAGQPSVD